METEKNKEGQEDNGRVNGNGGKPSTADEACNRDQTMTEEKVTQFFKILRRVHVAAQYLEKDNDGGNGRLPSKKRKRSESSRLENSVETNGVRDGECEGGRVGSPKRGLDLNSKPEPDGVDS